MDKRLKQVREELTRKDAQVNKSTKMLSRKHSRQQLLSSKARQQAATVLEVKRQTERARPQHGHLASYGAAKVLAIKLTRHDQVEKPA